MIHLSGFKQYVEKAEPTVAGTLDDELGVKSDTLAKHYSTDPIVLADVKLADGTYHSLLPVKIVPGTITKHAVTVTIDDTFSPNLNDKVLRKAGDEMRKVSGWQRQQQKMVIPLSTKTKNGTTLQDLLSQGWSAAAAGGGMGMGMGMGGMPGGMPL